MKTTTETRQPLWYKQKLARGVQKKEYLKTCKQRGKEMKKISALTRQILKEKKSDLLRKDFDIRTVEIRDEVLIDIYRVAEAYIFMTTKIYLGKFPLVDLAQPIKEVKKSICDLIIEDMSKSYQSKIFDLKKDFLPKYHRKQLGFLEKQLVFLKTYL